MLSSSSTVILLTIYFLATAIRCFVGSQGNYIQKECPGSHDNACLKSKGCFLTTRSCGVASTDTCIEHSSISSFIQCTCLSSLCNRGMPLVSSKTSQLAFLLLSFIIAAVFQKQYQRKSQ